MCDMWLRLSSWNHNRLIMRGAMFWFLLFLALDKQFGDRLSWNQQFLITLTVQQWLSHWLAHLSVGSFFFFFPSERLKICFYQFTMSLSLSCLLFLLAAEQATNRNLLGLLENISMLVYLTSGLWSSWDDELSTVKYLPRTNRQIRRMIACYRSASGLLTLVAESTGAMCNCLSVDEPRQWRCLSVVSIIKQFRFVSGA